MIHAFAPSASIGIRTYAEALVTALRGIEVAVDIADKPSARSRAHFHIGNSTRSLLPWLLRAPRPSLVTLHDVVPRDRLLRRAWPPIARRLFSPHRLIVHAQHSAHMLRELGYRGTIDVIPHGATVRRVDRDRALACRSDIAPSGGPIFVTAGVLKRAKHVGEILRASAAFPETCFLMVGQPGDEETRRALASAPPNVVHRTAPTTDQFEAYIAAADLLLTFRSDWVGEASGPVTQAHALGTPVAGWTLGTLPEYCGTEDVLFDPSVAISDAVARLVAQAATRGFERVPAESDVVTTWESSARMHANVYASMGWR